MVRVPENVKALFFIILNVLICALLISVFFVPCGQMGVKDKLIGSVFFGIMMIGGFLGYGMETRTVKKVLNALFIVFALVLFWKFILICS